MSRKKHKKRNEQQKRLQVTDASGWTRIIRGSRGQNHQSHISLHANEKLTEAPKDLTMDKVLEKFNKYCQKWKESTCFNDFQLILENDILASEQVNVTQCVCLGLGSLTSEDGRDASMYELAFLFTTLETLGPSDVPLSDVVPQLIYFQGRSIILMKSTFKTQFSITWTKKSSNHSTTRLSRTQKPLRRFQTPLFSSPHI